MLSKASKSVNIELKNNKIESPRPIENDNLAAHHLGVTEYCSLPSGGDHASMSDDTGFNLVEGKGSVKDTYYWSLLFNTLKIQQPTTTECQYGSLFVFLYGLGVGFAALYTLTEYSSIAVKENLAHLGLPSKALTAFEYIVKGAIISPLILTTATARDLAASLLRQAISLYQVEKSTLGIIKTLLRVLAKALLPLAIVSTAALSTGNLTYMRLKKGDNFINGPIDYFATMTVISILTCNFHLTVELFIKPLVKRWRQLKPSIERNTLSLFLTHYVSVMDARVCEALLAVNQLEDQHSNTAKESLWQHFCATRDASSIVELMAFLITYSSDVPLIHQKTAASIINNLKEIIKSILFLSFALIYALPLLVSGFKAGPFAQDLLGIAIPGEVIGLLAFTVNGMTNYYGMWALWAGLSALFANPNLCRQSYEMMVMNAIKSFVVSLFVIAQAGLAMALPLTYDKQYDNTIAKIQLIVAIFASAGLAMFSIGGPFQKLSHYQLAWLSRERLQSTSPPDLTTNDILVIQHYLKTLTTALAAELDRAPADAIEALYEQIDALLVRHEQNRQGSETDIEIGASFDSALVDNNADESKTNDLYYQPVPSSQTPLSTLFDGLKSVERMSGHDTMMHAATDSLNRASV